MDTCQNSPVFITLIGYIVTVTPALVSMDTEITFNTQNNRVHKCCDWLPRISIEVYLGTYVKRPYMEILQLKVTDQKHLIETMGKSTSQVNCIKQQGTTTDSYVFYLFKLS